ncbi:MAG: beta-N-acetylhexosaminidase, partial [Proteobacteria bacterium]|nr:beta-N-acetylhexosaminidase [Pseudomonadota bacterium]
MPLGPVMLGLPGLALGGADRELLRHPRVGGVILFARNYETPR